MKIENASLSASLLLVKYQFSIKEGFAKNMKIKKLLLFQLFYNTVCFFMGTNVFVHLTHLKLPRISKTYLKNFVWSGHLIKIHLE